MKALLLNKYLWMGLGGLFGLLLGIYFIADRVVMPMYTRHNQTESVPNVVEMPVDLAVQVLTNAGFTPELSRRRYSPHHDLNAVMEQDPKGGSPAKKGRRIYLAVNEASAPEMRMPNLTEFHLREARLRVEAMGLVVSETIADSLPSAFRNTIVRQSPAPDALVRAGDQVRIWYSTGLSDREVDVPDVVGLSVAQAIALLRDTQLQAIVVDDPGTGDVSTMPVLRQGRSPGAKVRGGYEIRLFVQAAPY
jgi:beta-lactam-binding protein with PASTA domain